MQLSKYDYRTHNQIKAYAATELLSYLQTHIDNINESGMYILTGSHNLLLMQPISQSLAGRTALLTLAPFSVEELRSKQQLPQTANQMLFNGGFPRIYDKHIEAQDFYPSYIKTYLDRDVRTLRDISDYAAFTRFIKLCAGRCSQIFGNYECGTNRKLLYEGCPV